MPTKPMTVAQHKLAVSHKGHAKHLCELTAKRFLHEVAMLSKNAKFVCHICGRASAKPNNLCEPVKIA